jgi:ATP-dependent RNA helicase RhlE
VNFDQFPLDRRIAAGIQAAGYTVPTPIQEQAIPLVLAGRDILGTAQTGTGKTAAFMLPILQRLMTGPTRKVRALILAPTRELAEQIYEVAKVLGQFTKVRAAAVYGGVSKGAQIDKLRSGVEIVVACPGRLLDLLGDRAINLSQVEVLVLDESDRMCDMGFLPDIRRILNVLPRERQTLFFSATMPDDIRRLADSILKDPATVQIGMIAPVETVSHAFYPVAQSQKSKLLVEMLRQTATGRVLIFTRTKYRARSLASDLHKAGFNVADLQGNLSQNRRQEALDGFRAGRYDFLVATDIAARGIDVTEITHVINFDMPDTVDAYIHRIGRTGRAEHSGEARTLLTPTDELMARDIEWALNEPVERRKLPGFEYTFGGPDTRLLPQGQPKPGQPRQERPRQPQPTQAVYRSSHAFAR